MADSNSLTPLELVQDFREIFRDSLGDEISDLDLATTIIDSTFFAIRDAADQELFFATLDNLDGFLVASVPEIADFNKERIILWAKEALEFAQTNIRHDSFSDIFSSRLQYDRLLEGWLVLDTSGLFLRNYFKDLQINSVFFADELPFQFINAVRDAARAAVRPALVGLAQHLIAYGRLGRPKPKPKIPAVTAIRRTPSFLNKKGTIPFSEHSGKFRIDSGEPTDQIKQYKPLVDRAIRKLGDARVVQRIGNRDKILTGLLSEYEDEVSRPAARTRVPILWTIGVEIQSCIQAHELVKEKDERLDDSDMLDLQRLMISHNLYLNCFPQTISLIRDIEASSAIYQRIGSSSRHLPSLLLRRSTEDSDLLEPETATIIERSLQSEACDAVESKGVVALRLGLLRGLLHSLSGHVLSGIEKLFEKLSLEISTKVIMTTLAADPLFSTVIAFVDKQAAALLQLSTHVPFYFGYIMNVLNILGHSI